jgi:hypothetical protein
MSRDLIREYISYVRIDAKLIRHLLAQQRRYNLQSLL